MTALSIVLALASGAAANQLDAPLSRINARGWELIARYIVGVMAAFAPFVSLVHAINPKATRDASLAYSGDVHRRRAWRGYGAGYQGFIGGWAMKNVINHGVKVSKNLRCKCGRRAIRGNMCKRCEAERVNLSALAKIISRGLLGAWR